MFIQSFFVISNVHTIIFLRSPWPCSFCILMHKVSTKIYRLKHCVCVCVSGTVLKKKIHQDNFVSDEVCVHKRHMNTIAGAKLTRSFWCMLTQHRIISCCKTMILRRMEEFCVNKLRPKAMSVISQMQLCGIWKFYSRG